MQADLVVKRHPVFHMVVPRRADEVGVRRHARNAEAAAARIVPGGNVAGDDRRFHEQLAVYIVPHVLVIQTDLHEGVREIIKPVLLLPVPRGIVARRNGRVGFGLQRRGDVGSERVAVEDPAGIADAVVDIRAGLFGVVEFGVNAVERVFVRERVRKRLYLLRHRGAHRLPLGVRERHIAHAPDILRRERIGVPVLKIKRHFRGEIGVDRGALREKLRALRRNALPDDGVFRLDHGAFLAQIAHRGQLLRNGGNAVCEIYEIAL